MADEVPQAAGETRQPWPRDTFQAAVWDSKLRPLERLVALAHADHAKAGDVAWVTYPRLQERTGLCRAAIARALKGLTEEGWLVVAEKAAQHRATRYRITDPRRQASVSQTADGAQPATAPVDKSAQQSVSQTADGAQQSVSRHQQSVSRHQQSARQTRPLLYHSETTPPAADAYEQRVRSHLAGEGIDTDEQDALLAYAAADPDTDTVGRLTTKWLPDARRAVAGQQRKRLAAELDRRKAEAPDCEHEWPAGTALHPGSRQPICPDCRRTSERASA